MQDMSQSSGHRHHAIDYVELTVTDLEQAKRFYTEAFGWRFNDYGPEYAGIQSPQGESAPEVGGLRQGREVQAGGPLVLLYSTDLDRSVEAVKHAGLTTFYGPALVPELGEYPEVLPFTDRFLRAKDEGDLPAHVDPEGLMRVLIAMLQGISVQATQGATREELDRRVGESIRLTEAR